MAADELTSGGARRQLDSARREFASAHDSFTSWVLAPLTVVPVAGRQLRALQDLSSGAGAVGRMDDGVNLGQERLPDRCDLAGPRGQVLQRPELPAGHWDDGQRSQHPRGERVVGARELPPGRVELAARPARGEFVRRRVAADLIDGGDATLVGAVAGEHLAGYRAD